MAAEIELSNAAEFAEALTEAVDGARPGLIVDISSVPCVDSAGLRALFDVISHLDAHRQVVALAVAESSPIRTLTKVTNLHDSLGVRSSEPRPGVGSPASPDKREPSGSGATTRRHSQAFAQAFVAWMHA